MDIAKKLIVALDVDSEADAQRLVRDIGAEVDFYKIGLRLLVRAGPALIRSLVRDGKQVFLDLKVHEIPSSAAEAIKAVAELGVSMVTIHAAGGTRMMNAAVLAAAPYPALKILAVTAVTSFADEDLIATGIGSSCEEHSRRLADAAMDSGCQGVVASANEVRALREILPPDMTIVTPGIRLRDELFHDHSRGATPAEAIRWGASYLVVGRPITQAKGAAAAVARYQDDMGRGVEIQYP